MSSAERGSEELVCSICGKKLSREEAFKCPFCGKVFCERHYYEHLAWEKRHEGLAYYYEPRKRRKLRLA